MNNIKLVASLFNKRRIIKKNSWTLNNLSNMRNELIRTIINILRVVGKLKQCSGVNNKSGEL